MPDLKDDDVPDKDPQEMEIDPYWDSLISNPDLRSAYNDALDAGFSGEDAHMKARVDVFGESHVREEYGDEAVDRLEGIEAFSDGLSKGWFSKKAPDTFDYEEVDECLFKAHERTVQWNADKRLGEYDISKAPGAWTSQDEVPEWVLESLKALINSGDVVWQGNYDRLPPGAASSIIEVLEERMTQPQGWSLDSLLRDLKEFYPDADDEYLLNILRNETSAVLNTAREEAYLERDDSEEYVYDWIGPNDHRTTDTCLDIQAEIESRGGAVPLPELKEILLEKAAEHQDREGTPGRVDDWQPHYQCRRTFVRRVQTI